MGAVARRLQGSHSHCSLGQSVQVDQIPNAVKCAVLHYLVNNDGITSWPQPQAINKLVGVQNQEVWNIVMHLSSDLTEGSHMLDGGCSYHAIQKNRTVLEMKLGMPAGNCAPHDSADPVPPPAEIRALKKVPKSRNQVAAAPRLLNKVPKSRNQVAKASR